MSREFIRQVPEEANRVKVAQFTIAITQNGPLTWMSILLIIITTVLMSAANIMNDRPLIFA